MASVSAIAQNIDVESVGVHVRVPQSDVAYLMYYLKCVLKGCGLDIIQDDLLDFANYGRLTSKRQDQVFLAAYTYSPDELLDKTIVCDNDGSICGSEQNVFLKISESTKLLHAQEEVLIVGQRKRCSSIMVFRKDWLEKFYMGPMKRNLPRLRRAMIATVTNHCEHCAGRSGKCTCDRCPRTTESKCSRTLALTGLMGALSEALDDALEKTKLEAEQRHCMHCKGLEATCGCEEGCSKLSKSCCITVHKNITCDSCGRENMVGTRYKCAECSNYELCQTCYKSNKHELSHRFHTVERMGMAWNTLEPRFVPKPTMMTRAKGFFYESMSIAEMKAYLKENEVGWDDVFEKEDLHRKVWECYCDSISAKELAQVIEDTGVDVSGCRDVRSRRNAVKDIFRTGKRPSVPGCSALKGDEQLFGKGQLVRLSGLKTADLNGKMGRVVGPCAVPGRAEVVLDDNNRKVKVKYENLEAEAELVD